jgi:hypothetical protein
VCYGSLMNSLSRYHPSQHENGLWHVVDAVTGASALVQFGGRFFLLWKLEMREAETWSIWLNKESENHRAS